MNVNVQFFTLVTMVGSGVFVTAMFDTYKILFRPTNYWNKVIVDTLFLLTMTCIVYYMLFIVNGGVIRFYLFLAVLLGISFYFALLQQIYLKGLQATIELVKKTYQLFKRLVQSILIRPLLWILQILLVVVVSLLQFIWKIVILILQFVRFLLKPLIPRIVQKYLLYFLTICSNIVNKTKNKIQHFWDNRRRKDGEGSSKKQ